MWDTLIKTCSIVLLFQQPVSAQSKEHFPQKVERNGMLVSWIHRGDRVYFEMEAPTEGWVTIGFNQDINLAGAYLLMGRIRNGQVEVIPHYVLAPGKYKSFSELKITSSVQDVSGHQSAQETTLDFSLPVTGQHHFERDLTPGCELVMILAFSREDDFQHHSIMRTSLRITM